MNKEEYLKLRNNNELNYELFYEYYQIHCKQPLVTNLDQFIQVFTVYFDFIKNWNNPIMQCPYSFDNQLIVDYFDNKFNVMKIMDLKTNQIIRYE